MFDDSNRHNFEKSFRNFLKNHSVIFNRTSFAGFLLGKPFPANYLDLTIRPTSAAVVEEVIAVKLSSLNDKRGKIADFLLGKPFPALSPRS